MQTATPICVYMFPGKNIPIGTSSQSRSHVICAHLFDSRKPFLAIHMLMDNLNMPRKYVRMT